jgi:hypothetical protein
MRALSEIPLPTRLLSVPERFVCRRLTSRWQLNRDAKPVLRWYLDEPAEQQQSRSPQG